MFARKPRLRKGLRFGREENMPSTKAVLIIGGSGFIGSHLALRLRDGYKVFATYFSNPLRIRGVTGIPLDVSNRNWVKRIVYSSKPDVVIYCAGNNSLEWAEYNARDTERLHTGGPATVSTISDILQPKFIYLSNAYVFDGNKGNYKEGDTVLPSSILGKTKVGGENFIRGKAFNHIIVRTSLLFGRGNGINTSLIDDLRMKFETGQRIELATDELHSFAPISAFTDFIVRLVDSGPRNKTVHYGGLTKLTPCEFARAFATRFGYDPALVFEKKTGPRDESMLVETQTFDYSLNSSFIVETLKVQPLLLEEGFDLFEKSLVTRL
ncbi:MAG: hypothetical protein A2583_10635 [Bdellovibrionales bacterium RIFOXYD1_FULL_53_11]|nr:MAG: hypothetical protein A2583_10635 [Bdellovibrionales bacterium RIFOXYD1_FULL_53_11]